MFDVAVGGSELKRSEVLSKYLRAASFLLAGFAVCGYVYLLITFQQEAFYYQHFFDHGARVTQYLVTRLIFMSFVAWLIYAPGIGLLTIVGGRHPWKSLPLRERYALGFLVGAGLWNVTLFVVGLLGLYRRVMMVSMTVTLLILSVPHLATCLREAAIACTRVQEWRRRRLLSVTPGILVLGVVLGLFLLIKGLYPAGGHDYYTHYFPYYRRVVNTGSILPNEVWYHFYYSKGAGLFFLGMLLTDPLAPSLVATCFIGVGACLVYAILRSGTQSATLAWIGVVMFIALLIYTPGPAINRANGGWGDLEKHHEITAVLILGVIWIMSRVVSIGRSSALWLTGLCACIVSTGLITISLLFMIGLYCLGFVVWFAWRRQWHEAIHAFIACCVGGLTMASVLAVNQFLTGLALEDAALSSWPVANLHKINDWGVMFEVVKKHLDYTELVNAQAPWSMIGRLLFTSLRLELWWPMFLTAAPLMIVRLSDVRFRRELGSRLNLGVLLGLVWFVAITVVAAAVSGRSQPISFYRLSSFSYGITLCLALIVSWVAWSGDWRQTSRYLVAAFLGITIGVWALNRFASDTIQQAYKDGRAILTESLSLATGRFSLRDAYQQQQGWPGRLAFGGIYPPLETVWRLLPRDTRILSFHIHSYCMLPDCNVESMDAFRVSRRWQSVFFDTADRGAEVLHSEGADYFFFSKELYIYSLLPAAPVFSPEHIHEHLGVKWTDGTSYLLTWLGSDVEPLDARFLQAYAKSLANPLTGGYRDFLRYRKDFAAVAAYMTAQGNDVQPFFLPWCTTCDGLPRIPRRGDAP